MSGARTSKPYVPGSGPRPKPTHAPGFKQPSWIRLPQAGARGPVHVGSIYFRTKETELEQRDRLLLDQLADSFTRAARRNGPPEILKGRIVGFADPQPSQRPSNAQLSDKRAAVVSSTLSQAFAHRQLAVQLVPEGAGVDPVAPTVEDTGLEDVLAPFRRVDVYLVGEADDENERDRAEPGPPDASQSARHAPAPPKPPDYRDEAYRHDFDRFTEHMSLGSRGNLQGIAGRITSNSEWGVDANLVNDLIVWGVVAMPPPWWRYRNETAPDLYYKRAQDGADPKLVRHAQQLAADYRLFSFYVAEHDRTIAGFVEAVRRGDHATADRHRPVMAHLLFMILDMKRRAYALEEMVDA